MKPTPEHNERIAKLTFASVYPHYIKKVESKGRTKKELHQVIEWLTGFDDKKLQKLIDENATFESAVLGFGWYECSVSACPEIIRCSAAAPQGAAKAKRGA